MDGRLLNEQDSINILGVKFDYKLTFKQHIETLANKASQKLSGFRWILHLLTEDNAFQLHKSQVRSVMEYARLAWNGAPQTHLGLLDKVEARATKLIYRLQRTENPTLDSLQHRRDVAGLTVLYKAAESQHRALGTPQARTPSGRTATRDRTRNPAAP